MLVNKPNSMSVREWLMKTLSQRDNIPQITIAAIVSHQYDEASTALNDNNSIEISGFGKFYYNEKRADKEMTQLLNKKEATEQMLADDSISEKKRWTAKRRLAITNKNIELLKTKI